MEPKLFLKAISQYFGYQIRETRKAPSLESSFLHLDSQYDQKFLLKNREVDLILDIGAHAGETAKSYHRTFPNAKILSFEPFPNAFLELEKNCKSIKQIEPQQLAVADFNGESNFYTSGFSPMNSLLKFASDSQTHYDRAVISEEDKLIVKTVTLDSFCFDRGIKKINICKMDIQGAELLALQGAKQLLKDLAIDLLYLEVSFNKIYESQAWFHDISDFLVKFDYKLFGIYNFYHGKDNFFLAQGDAIFISPNLLTK